MNNFCPHCGSQTINGICPNGHNLQESGNQNINSVPVTEQTEILGEPIINMNQQPVQNVAPVQNNILVQNKEGLGTASLVLGIISLIFSFFISIFILPLAIIGLVLGIVNKVKKGKKIAGIVLNIIAIVIAIFMFVVGMMIVTSNPDIFDSDIIPEENKLTYEEAGLSDQSIRALESLKNWNRYSSLRQGSLGKYTTLNGEWRILENSEEYFKFENNQFWWYKSVNNLNDNYYQGTMQIYYGESGLKQAGYSDEKINQLKQQKQNSNGGYDQIYTLIMTPTKLISNGEDKSSTNIPSGTKWTQVWIVINHKEEGIEAQVANLNTAEALYYVKVKD